MIDIRGAKSKLFLNIKTMHSGQVKDSLLFWAEKFAD